MTKETINLPRLISLIANGAGVDPVTARRFLHELFAQIEESLIAGERVEVKGVGEFVRSDNPAEPVLFRPDARLAEIANEPFSIFTAVEVNDGAEAEIAAVATPAAVEVAEETITAPAPAETVEPEHEQPATEPSQPEEPEQESEEEQPAERPSEEPAELPAEEPATAEEPAPTEQPAEEPAPQDAQPEDEPAQPVRGYIEKSDPSQWEQYDDENYSEAPLAPASRQGSSNNMMWLFLGLLIGLILGLVGGYFAGKTMAAYEFDEEEMMPFADEDTTHVSIFDEVAPANSEPAASEHVATETSSVEDDEKPSAAETESPAAPATEQQPAAKPAEPVYDTVSAHRYLTIMAKEHYGVKNYWVFIYEANPGLGNPDRVKAGTRVRIPAKEEFMEATKEATDAKASKLMQQIMARYK